MKPKLSVYIATSIDGFIARKDGGIDWLEFDSGGDSDGEDYGAHGGLGGRVGVTRFVTRVPDLAGS